LSDWQLLRLGRPIRLVCLSGAGAPSTFAFITQPAGVWITSPAIALLTWYHLVGTYDGTNASFYLNGALVGTQKAAGFVANTVNNNGVNPITLAIVATLPDMALLTAVWMNSLIIRMR